MLSPLWWTGASPGGRTVSPFCGQRISTSSLAGAERGGVVV